MMTKTQALRVAQDRVRMFKQGRGWIVAHLRPGKGDYHSNQMSYETARGALLEGRLSEALAHLGYDDDDICYLADKYSEIGQWAACHGDLSYRLSLALAEAGPVERG